MQEKRDDASIVRLTVLWVLDYFSEACQSEPEMNPTAGCCRMSAWTSLHYSVVHMHPSNAISDMVTYGHTYMRGGLAKPKGSPQSDTVSGSNIGTLEWVLID